VSNLREAMDFIESQIDPKKKNEAPRTEPIPAEPLKSQPAVSLDRLEHLAEQIVTELRRHNEPPAEFSVSKLLAGILQVLALAVMFIAYINRSSSNVEATILVGIYLQTLTVALLLMGK
jgi:hypothetical protein